MPQRITSKLAREKTGYKMFILQGETFIGHKYLFRKHLTMQKLKTTMGDPQCFASVAPEVSPEGPLCMQAFISIAHWS